jgi:hypothetical protein
MPEEIEKAIREMPRHAEVIHLLKREKRFASPLLPLEFIRRRLVEAQWLDRQRSN